MSRFNDPESVVVACNATDGAADVPITAFAPKGIATTETLKKAFNIYFLLKIINNPLY